MRFRFNVVVLLAILCNITNALSIGFVDSSGSSKPPGEVALRGTHVLQSLMDLGTRMVAQQTPVYELVGRGVAKASDSDLEVWIGKHNLGVQGCYAAVMKDSRCIKDYFTYVERGDKNCGCKGSAAELAIRGPGGTSDYYKIPISPEVDARNEFVHSCHVMLSVRDPRDAPADVVEEFCYSTIDVVECKMKLSSVLKQKDEGGGSINAFCRTMYGWFQDKYGKYCTSQCHLLQCKPTCDWLSVQKNLTDNRAELNKSFESARQQKFRISELNYNLTLVAEDIVELQRVSARANESLANSKARLQKKEEDYKLIAGKDEAFKNKIAATKKKLEDDQTKLHHEEDQLRERQHEFTLKNASYHDALADIDRCTARVDKFAGQISRMQPKYDDISTRLAAISVNMSKESKNMEELSTRMGKERGLVEKAKKNLQTAEEQLEDGLNAKVSAQTEDDYRSLVATQKRRLTEAKDDLHLSEHLLHEARVRQKLAREFKAKLQTENDELEEQKRKLTGERQNAEECVTSGEQQADHFSKEMEKAETAIEQQEESLYQANKTWRGTNASLYGANDAKDYEVADLKRTSGMLKLSRMEVEDLEEAANVAAKKWFARQDYYNNGKKKENELTLAWQSENKQLLDQITLNTKAIEDHALTKPEMVKQHSLGLAQAVQH